MKKEIRTRKREGSEVNEIQGRERRGGGVEESKEK